MVIYASPISFCPLEITAAVYLAISSHPSFLRPAHTYAAHRVADTSEIRQGMRHDAARRVAAKVSCYKMDRVVSLALLCEEAEN